MENIKKQANYILLLFGITVTISLTVVTVAITTATTTTPNMNTAEAETTPTTIPATGDSVAFKVQAGGGNSTNVLIRFIPQQVKIKVSQSVSWYNPTTVGEPHIVTFALDNKTMTNVVGQFSVQIQHNLHLYRLALTMNQLWYLEKIML